MFRPRIKPVSATTPALSHEDLFVQNYPRLLNWALSLTAQDQESAEDLVHDTFLHFTLNRPELLSIQNLDGYLYTSLRNMHLSRVRRASRVQQRTLAIAEYDSAEIVLRAPDLRAQLQVHDELRAFCRYANVRKETSKAGSVLILRFFLAYFVDEITSIMRCPRGGVYQWLRLARREARLYLAEPGRLKFMNQGLVESPADTSSQNPNDLLLALRRRIWETRQGECLTTAALKELYHTGASTPIESSVLAHLVTCPRCLDQVNHILGLPLLAERYPTDSLGSDSGPRDGGRGPGGGGSARGAGGKEVGKYRRRLKEVVDHYPQELHISVNGFELGSQRISAERSDQRLTVNLTEPISFVEVLSEQGLRLMFVDVTPPPEGEVQQHALVSLSDDRSVEMSLTFGGPWPDLQVVYRDPGFAANESVEVEVQSAESNVQSRGSSPTLSEGLDRGSSPTVREGSVEVPSSKSQVSSPKSQVSRPSRAGSALLRKLRTANLKPGTWYFELFFRPATVTALIALLLIGLAVFLGRQRTLAPFTSAAHLLAQSVAAEEAMTARTDQVLHRTVTLEERKPSGELIARSKIEVWHSAERGLTVRRVYDEQNRLLAGDWRRADGVETLYAHGTNPQIRSLPNQHGAAGINPTTINFGDIWQQNLSARDFAALATDANTLRLDETAAGYVLTYQRAAAVGLRNATLVLSRSDLHATEQTFTVCQGDEERTYHYLETSFERRPPRTVAPAVFEPDAQLLSSTEPETPNSKLETALPPGPRPLTPALATPELEVEVLRLLNQAGADMGEQVSVTRTPDGRLQIQGLVETPARKRELLQALDSVRANPAVVIQISSVNEVLQRQSKNASSQNALIVEGNQPAASAIPVDAELRRYFATRGLSDEQVTASVRRFADGMVERSSRALQHAWALKRLAERFSAEDQRTLSPEVRTKWMALIKTHALRVQQENVHLRQELQSVFGGQPGAVDELEIADDAALVRAIERLLGICAANHRAITAAFTISSDSSSSSAVKTQQFARALATSESLAGKISRQ